MPIAKTLSFPITTLQGTSSGTHILHTVTLLQKKRRILPYRHSVSELFSTLALTNSWLIHRAFGFFLHPATRKLGNQTPGHAFACQPSLHISRFHSACESNHRSQHAANHLIELLSAIGLARLRTGDTVLPAPPQLHAITDHRATKMRIAGHL
ncbi:hypothetical protein E2542_SST08834 [Spatholobus suberectus]|nr:hypothetical protein E2542_SST08834 [Spatholobus suberectus]